MRKASFSERIRYLFDNTLSKGPISLILWLAVISLIFIALSSFIVWGARLSPETSIVNLFWDSAMTALDAGSIDREAGTWPFVLTMFGISLLGIFVTSTLIGVLTASLEERLQNLRKGRSKVIESGHTIILGWSEQVFPIISELLIAHANKAKSRIVIMGNKDKVEIEDQIREKVGSTGRTRIICRTGNPIELSDLEIVSLQTSHSIVILSPDNDAPDSDVIKTMLAIVNNPNRRPEPYHIVAQIRDPQNLEAAKIVGQDEVELVLVGDMVSRIIAQTSRQSGLSVVYTELLDFSGDEIYFQTEPTLVGKTFGQALLAYEDSAVIGLRFRDGTVKLNPPMDTPFQTGDQVIAISQDDDTVVLSGKQELEIQEGAIQTGHPPALAPERTLILGWNWRAPLIIKEMDNYVPPGSEITVVADVAEAEVELSRKCSQTICQSVNFQLGDTTDRSVLEQLAAETYDHVIILCYSDTLPLQQADARTLVTLLHLRDIAQHSGKSFSIVSEMLDIQNRDLAAVARADDFIVSDRLISLVLSQISENKALNAVFADLFDPEGSEVYLKPAANYVKLDRSLNFYTIVEAARRRGEIALGYRLHARADDATTSYGVVINPDKSAPVSFGQKDCVIVLAEGM